MILGVVDTNILIEIYRDNLAGKAWLNLHKDMAITSITWLEFMEGARGRAGQNTCLQIISSFTLLDLTAEDQLWARNQLLLYRLSRGVSFADCLIASVAYRLQIPLYTRNTKDFLPLLGSKLVLKPY